MVERVADDRPLYAEFLNNLGVAQLVADDFVHALESLTSSLGIKRQTLGEEHPEVAYTLANIAWLKMQAMRFEEAAVDFEHALAIIQSSLGPTHPTAAAMEYNLGWALRFSGKPAQATTRLRHVVELHAKHGTTADLEQCHLGLGLAALSLNDPLAAQRHITTAATLTAARGDDRLGKAALHEAQGELRGALGDVPGAQWLYDAATTWQVCLVWPAYLVIAAFSPALLAVFGDEFTAASTSSTSRV